MTTRAAAADSAFRAGRRRRATRSAIDTAVDGLIASGGLVFANATFGLGVGLPEGAGGSTLGATLLLAGIAWLARSSGRAPRPQRAVVRAMRPARARTQVARAAVVVSRAA